MRPYGEKTTVELRGWLALYIFVLSVFLFCSLLMFIYTALTFRYGQYVMSVVAVIVGVVQLKIVSICFFSIRRICGVLKSRKRMARSRMNVNVQPGAKF
jgi:hypothetical protein